MGQLSTAVGDHAGIVGAERFVHGMDWVTGQRYRWGIRSPKRGGAAEARKAHNLKVGGSKPPSAIFCPMVIKYSNCPRMDPPSTWEGYYQIRTGALF